jgi:ATP-dependent helicase/DNAse subunit B
MGLHLRRKLALTEGFPGHANIRFMTLVDFARDLCAGDLLKSGRLQPTVLLEHLLLEQVVSAVVPDGGYFGEVRDQEVFSRSLRSTLTDLKEACVSPEEMSRWANTFPEPAEGGHKLKELALVYAEYARRSGEIGLVDRNDLLALAVDAGRPATDLGLFIYGFYDFNPLQKKFLEAILRQREVLIFFPWREGVAFDYALPSLTWLTNLGCEHIPLKPTEARPMARVTTNLFDLPEQRSEEPPLEDLISVISAPGEAREVQEIARACLSWVENRAISFSDIGILLRNSEPYNRLFAETFSRLGIPHYLHGGRPLSKSRAGQSVRLLLKILTQDFSRSSVMELITYAPISFERFLGEDSIHANPALWDFFAIRAGIVGGRLEWRERLEHLYRRLQWEAKQEERAEAEHMPAVTADLASLRALIAFLEPFFRSIQTIPRQGRWSEFSRSLGALLRELLPPELEAPRVIDEIEAMSAYDLLSEEISLDRFARAVEAVLTAAEEQTERFGRGGVFIGDLMSARGITFKAVILPGMIERFFPRPWRQDPILLDHERQYFSEKLGRELPLKNRGYDEERTLFTLALMAARERLLLSFPRLDVLTGRERIPSFFLLRLMEAAEGRPAHFTDLESWGKMQRVPLGRLFPREVEDALDSLEFDLSRADAAVKGKELTPLRYLSSASPFFSRSLQAEAERWGERRLTGFDGSLQGRKSRAFLKKLYPTNETILSPTRLETYARCPYRYFAERLLGLAPLDEPDRFAVLSPLDRGVLIHDILYRFLNRLKEKGRLPLRSQKPDFLSSLLIELAEIVLKRFELENATGFPLLWSVQKEQIMEDLRGFLEAELAEEEAFSPFHLETDFSCPFELDGGERLTFRGRIDRIDLDNAGRRARVIDYKTGRPTAIEDGEFKGGEALQLPIYLCAATSLLKDVEVVEADYYFVTRAAEYRKTPFTRKDWPGKLTTLRKITGALIQGMRQGLFVARPSSCSRGGCLYPWLCTPAAEVLYERKSQDPKIRFFEGIKEIP